MAVIGNMKIKEEQIPQIITLHPGLSFSFGKTPLFGLPLSSEKIVVRGGDICAVFGPNGCGKTTLLNLISGFLRPTVGQVHFASNGDTLSFALNPATSMWPSPAARIAQWQGGVRRTFQVPVISPEMSVAQHIFVARRLVREESFISWFSAPFRRGIRRNNSKYEIDDASYVEFEQLLKELGLNESISNPDTLSYGQKRLLNILQAIFGSERLLVLDEPFANLSPSVVDVVKGILRDFVSSKDRAVVLVEHRAKNLSNFVNGIITMISGQLRFDEIRDTDENQELFISNLVRSYYD